MANEPVDVFKHYNMDVEPDECWQWKGTWGGRDRDKRPYITCGGTRSIAYRLVYTLASGEQLTQEQNILHSCDNGGWPIGCGNPAHLTVGTNRQNVNDRLLRQRHGLSHSVVNNIRKLLAKGDNTHAQIADVYGVSRETVTAIANNRTYQYVKDEDDAGSDN